ncbi:MAG TPA: methylenetetrahydrofolate reductase [Desulfobacteraceae bacterium]|nr:methylenetetrahydrofolate reductase [Deltaproteobacteria bacterium]MBW2355338.1 methylenetetrahydrofolate reductase [Deltaproteobacteria bacterium]RLB97578.1 MAG: methylenetetrahydrofolate reductase [Deltaproteobacteria bacterium]HDI59046.1 methylenetetrahydrofolate reductase [Desulfobacteraceae bacterium]
MSANGLKSGSNLEKILKAGHFAFTGECGPPKGANVEHLREKYAHLRGVVDAINVTDNQTAVVRLSSMASCALMVADGLEPNFQMVCRDRNRLAMMADIFGAYALGIRNMLCLSGDHQHFGNHPQAKNVFDIDSMQLIALVRKLRDEGKFPNGDEVDGPPRMFIGAACNPFGDPTEFRVHRLANKVDAGVDFVQTQCIYNMERFRQFMRQAVDMGLAERCYILAGVTPMKSARMAKYMAKFVPGMDVPEALIKRLEGAEKGKQAEEGIAAAIEQIQEFKEMPGVAGVHLMAIEWEHKVPEIAQRAGVLPRPEV